MNIAELFVRLRADNSDLDRKLLASERQMARLHGSTQRLETGFRGAQLQTGRLGNQFASLASQIAGVHPIVGNLAQVMGNFAVGGLVTVGILGATAIFAKFFDVMTRGAREAKKESDDLIASLEKAIHLKGLGPGGIVVDETAAANARAAALGKQIALMRGMIVADAMDADVMASNLVIQEKINKLVIERQNALNTAAGGQSIVDEKVNEAIKAQIPHVAKLKDTYMNLRDAIEKVRKETEEFGLAFWRNLMNARGEADELTKSMTDLMRPMMPSEMPNADVSGSGVNINMGMTKEQIKTREEMGIFIDDANKNAKDMQNAIWGAASQSAGLIVNALNIGGGGRGSNLGGALGGTAGFAAGFMIGGPVGGAIGSTIGSIAGSLFGGLFDSHKKEVNRNTQALRELTAAIYNSPSGYKVEAGRFAATDVKGFGKAALRYSTRGGAPVLAGAR